MSSEFYFFAADANEGNRDVAWAQDQRWEQVCNSIWIALINSQRVREVSHQPVFMGSCLTTQLRRTIHQHPFSHLACAKFTDCMTCLSSQKFLFCFSHTVAFSPVLLCLSLHMFQLVFVSTCLFPCFHLFTIFPFECTPIWLNRRIHQHTFSRMNRLTLQGVLFYFPHTIAFLPVLHCFSLHVFEFVFVLTCLFLCFY